MFEKAPPPRLFHFGDGVFFYREAELGARWELGDDQEVVARALLVRHREVRLRRDPLLCAEAEAEAEEDGMGGEGRLSRPTTMEREGTGAGATT